MGKEGKNVEVYICREREAAGRVIVIRVRERSSLGMKNSDCARKVTGEEADLKNSEFLWSMQARTIRQEI
jgi:hypothetical protein